MIGQFGFTILAISSLHKKLLLSNWAFPNLRLWTTLTFSHTVCYSAYAVSSPQWNSHAKSDLAAPIYFINPAFPSPRIKKRGDPTVLFYVKLKKQNTRGAQGWRARVAHTFTEIAGGQWVCHLNGACHNFALRERVTLNKRERIHWPNDMPAFPGR